MGLPFDLPASLWIAFATNNRINEYLIRNVPDEAWRAQPPNGKGRDIASIVAHMHNVRLMWLKAIDRGAEIQEKLEGEKVTKDAAIKALAASWKALDAVLRKALISDGRIKGFKPDAGSFLAYLLAHDAHHRGQILMLAGQSGHAVSQSVNFGMWEWGTR